MQSVSELTPGAVIGGKFRIEQVIGRGGMGVVFAAEHLELRQRVAVKCLLHDPTVNAIAVERFLREARVAASLQNEHVVRVTDIGRFEDGAPFIVMEYLEGLDLGRYLQTHGPLPVERAVELVLEAAVALAEAHRLGIIHRDVKPSNLFLAQRGDGSSVIKVLDFGISKVVAPDAADGGLTTTAVVVGSPHYMSPEQIRGSAPVDARTDIWSVGIVLYQLVTGRLPFAAGTGPGLLMAIGTDPPEALSLPAGEGPKELEKVILRCLEKRPQDRFASILELAEALARAAPSATAESLVDRIRGTLSRSADAESRTRASDAAGEPSRETITAHTFCNTQRARRASRRVTAVILAGAVAVAVIAAAWVVFRPLRVSADKPGDAIEATVSASALVTAAGPGAGESAQATTAPSAPPADSLVQPAPRQIRTDPLPRPKGVARERAATPASAPVAAPSVKSNTAIDSRY